MDSICKLTGADQYIAEYIVNHIERVVSKETENAQIPQISQNRPMPSQTAVPSTPLTKLQSESTEDLRQPNTPTDVQDIHF